MKRGIATVILAMVSALLLPAIVSAQLSRGGVPLSFSLSVPPLPDIVTVVPPNLDRLASEDAINPEPFRFAVNLPVDLGIGRDGQWTTAPDGRRMWRVNIRAEGALALVLYFDEFRLPEGGRLFLYNFNRTQLLGAYTEQNNSQLPGFAAGMIQGDRVTLEYDAPADIPLPLLHLSEIGYAYRGVSGSGRGTDGFGSAGKCQVNMNCPEGAPWQREKRSVARIAVKRGAVSVWCSGTLINNVRNDGTPYVLTADHCGMSSSVIDLGKWIFYFGYECPACSNPLTEPYQRSLTGASLVAHGGNGGNSGSDFYLVKLFNNVPDTFNLYYAGWNRDTENPSPSGAGIHHPQGDIKKISTYTSPLVPGYWAGNPKQAFWQVAWVGTASGHGTTEGGSSGSPLFDDQGRLVGTLTGGDSSCDSAALDAPDYYGMFSYHWDQNGSDSANVLKYWLDPDNTNVLSINGWALSAEENQAGKGGIGIFPNPVKDLLWIRADRTPAGKLQLSLKDLWGNPVLDQEWTLEPGQSRQLDLSGLPGGFYLLTVSDGVHLTIHKLVKE
jgi:hypothetical protein